MNKQKTSTLILLVLGLLFSTILVGKFNWYEGLVFSGLLIQNPIQFFDLAFRSSSQLFLTTQLIGYAFYLAVGIVMVKNFSSKTSGFKLLTVFFLVVIGLVFLHDMYALYQELNNTFTGRHFRVGFSVFLIGITLIVRNYKSSEFKESNFSPLKTE